MFLSFLGLAVCLLTIFELGATGGNRLAIGLLFGSVVFQGLGLMRRTAAQDRRELERWTRMEREWKDRDHWI